MRTQEEKDAIWAAEEKANKEEESDQIIAAILGEIEAAILRRRTAR